ncbi:MAG TPA: phytanoyl-CoA dioxygenase family protein [Stellaceae bacterium]
MLSAARKAEFAERGFIVLRGAVPAALVAAARDKIDRSLAADASIGRNRWFADNSFCPDLVRDPTIVALLRGTSLLSAVEELFGAPDSARVNDSAQIALRFPDMRAEPGHGGPHIDGFPAGTNQVAPGEVWRQTALVGVYLSAAAAEMGNFVVWPGSPRRIAAFMRDRDAPVFLRAQGAEALLAAAMSIDLGAPEPLIVAPGDAVIAHHLLAHSVAWNLSLRLRYAVYFRVLHRDDQPRDPAPLMDERRFFAGAFG